MATNKIRFYFLLFIILALTVKFYSIITMFLPAIVAACILANIFNPLYIYTLRITKMKSVSAIIIIIIINSIIIIPIIFLLYGIQKDILFIFTHDTFNNIKNTIISIKSIINDKYSINISNYFDISNFQLAGDVQRTVAVLGPKIFISITGFALSTFITIFIMYYILTESNVVISTFKDYFPLSSVNCDKLFHEISRHTRALVLGQLLIAILQGILGGIGFLIFGIKGALLWGFVTVIMSLIPFLGAMVVWFPAGLIELAQHNYFSGIGIMLWSGLFVGIIDNIVRPKLTSSLGNIHPVNVILGVFIGIKEWGLIGLVLGPLIITTLLILISMFREEYKNE